MTDRAMDLAAPTFEGRPLPRPDEQLVDQGLAFDVATLVSRRRMLRVLGLGVAGLGLAACGGSSDSDLTEIPEETAGPYPGDGSNGPDALEATGVVRRDIRSSFDGATGTADGVPMTIELTLRDISNDGAPYAGAAVYVWHCNRLGQYSMYTAGATDQNWLRGVQVSEAAGRVSFTSIFPACYPGRWPHIHFEVYPDADSITDANNIVATSQIALPKDVCDAVYATTGYEQSASTLARLSLASDNVFRDDGGVHQLGTASGDVTTGYTVALIVPLDPTT